MTKLEIAEAAYEKAKSRRHLLWSLGASETLAQAEADLEAARDYMWEVKRSEPFEYEDGAGAAWQQHQQNALDDA